MFNQIPNMENYSPYYFDPQMEQLPAQSANAPAPAKKGPGRKRKIKTEPTDGNTGEVNGTNVKVKQEKITGKLTVRKKRDRFNGMPEEEVLARTLPDHMAPNLDIVIVGINPGLYAAYVGHHYAGPGNHFWKCLYLSGLIPEPMTAYEDSKLLEHGIGFTNIVARTTRGSSDLTRKEIKEGATILAEKLRQYKPKIAVFNGKGIYEIFLGHKNFHIGKQPDLLEGTETTVYVMPSSSARCSQLPRAVDKVPFYVALKKLRDYLRGDMKTLDEAEVIFPDLELKVKTEKTEEPTESTQTQQMMPTPQPDWSACNQSQPGSNNGNGMCSVVKQEKSYDPRDYGMMPAVSQNCYTGQPPSMGFPANYPGMQGMSGHSQASPNMGAFSACQSMGMYPVKMEPGTTCMYGVMPQQQQQQQTQHAHQQQHSQHMPNFQQMSATQPYYSGQSIPNFSAVVKREPPSFGYGDCMTISDPNTGTTHIQL
ncbi:G/T mismatch-specific thymine DNA glycosylase-like [Liolophura sinensis]|uniref:G/T mismatch-specific thymine DNA glycosylase-like n=1 Tax=Liolophura sinensis TaxID=3198878 RepID=UPI0031591169